MTEWILIRIINHFNMVEILCVKCRLTEFIEVGGAIPQTCRRCEGRTSKLEATE